MAKKSSNNGNETRSKKLIGDYINFINDIDKDDIKANLTFDKLKKLKSVISNINNIFTLLATRAVAGKIADAYKFKEEDRKKLFDQIEKTKANANGYDIEWKGYPDNSYVPKNPKILVEVKCNKPLNNLFGGAQLTALENDINNLLDGKGNLKEKGTVDYIKILAIVDFKDDDGESHIGELKDQIKDNTKQEGKVDDLKPWGELSRDKVYICVLSEEDLKNELDAVIKDLGKPKTDSEK